MAFILSGFARFRVLIFFLIFMLTTALFSFVPHCGQRAAQLIKVSQFQKTATHCSLSFLYDKKDKFECCTTGLHSRFSLFCISWLGFFTIRQHGCVTTNKWETPNSFVTFVGKFGSPKSCDNQWSFDSIQSVLSFICVSCWKLTSSFFGHSSKGLISNSSFDLHFFLFFCFCLHWKKHKLKIKQKQTK